MKALPSGRARLKRSLIYQLAKPAVSDQLDQLMAIPSGPGQFVVGASCAIAAVTIAAGWLVMMRLGVTTRLSAPDLTALRFPIGKAALSADDDVRKRPA